MTNRQLKTEYDAIVIGGGHNGLIAAAYLAKQNKKVLVLERREMLGGCSVTEELWPGYKVSTASYVVSLLLPEIIQELKLKENGLEILRRSPSSFTPTHDGKYLLLGPDMKSNQQEISKFSKKDAEVFPKYEKLLEEVADCMEPLLSKVAPQALPMPASWRRVGWVSQARDLMQLWKLRKSFANLQNSIPEAVELLTAAARPILERWFESDVLRATLATDAIIGAFASISAPGTAYVLLHHVMGSAGGSRGVWGYIRGGMGGLANAVEKACRQLGVDIECNASVARIDCEAKSVKSVTLADGRSFRTRVVASTVDANLTFNRFLDASQLPKAFLDGINRIDYSSASMKINLALSEPPQFKCIPNPGVGPQHNGTMHICDSIDWIERAYVDALLGEPSKRPILEMTMATSVDDTIAPPGKHLVSIFVQYAPYRLRAGLHWDAIKDDFAKRCISVISEFAPNVPNAIEHMQVISPLDLERTFSLTGGNIFQGAMNLNQLFVNRPIAGWADHRTPIKGLYLCGSASHPGGGVMGACGRNGAQVILQDRLA